MDIVTIWAGVATIGCGALTYAYLMTKIDLDEVRADFKAENGLNQVFEARINTLRSDNIELEREVGRLKAEAMVKTVKRGKDGKFVSNAKPAPISCG